MAKIPKDLLQPSNPRFKKVYGHDPIQKRKESIKRKKKDKEDRKVRLEEKYWKMRKEGKIKAREERELKRVILQEREKYGR